MGRCRHPAAAAADRGVDGRTSRSVHARQPWQRAGRHSARRACGPDGDEHRDELRGWVLPALRLTRAVRPATIAALYPSHDAYLAAVKAATAANLAAGYILEHDANATIREAERSDIGRPVRCHRR